VFLGAFSLKYNDDKALFVKQVSGSIVPDYKKGQYLVMSEIAKVQEVWLAV